MIKIIINFVILLCLCSCENSFDSEYSAIWAETTWTYKFYLNGTFVMSSKGHAGNSSITGEYYKNSKTIVTFLKNEDEENNLVAKRMYVVDSHCISDLNGTYYCDYKDSAIENIQNQYSINFEKFIDSLILSSKDFEEYSNYLKSLDKSIQIFTKMKEVVLIQDKVFDLYGGCHSDKRGEHLIFPYRLRTYIDRRAQKVYKFENEELMEVGAFRTETSVN